MIGLCPWGAPKGLKVSIMLEEGRFPSVVHPVDIRSEAQTGLAVPASGRLP